MIMSANGYQYDPTSAATVGPDRVPSMSIQMPLEQQAQRLCALRNELQHATQERNHAVMAVDKLGHTIQDLERQIDAALEAFVNSLRSPVQ